MVESTGEQTLRFRSGEALTAPQREHVRALATKASETVARNWPVRSVIARNPLEGYEHLPFEQAVERGRDLFGGRGYLANDEFRELYQQGRVSRDDLLDALRDRLPAWATHAAVTLGQHRIELIEVALTHLAHGIEGPPCKPFPRAPTRELPRGFRDDVPTDIRRRALTQDQPTHGTSASDAQLEAVYLADLWAAAVECCAGWAELPDGSAHGTARTGAQRVMTLGELRRASSGVLVSDIVNQQIMKWCRAFLDEGLAAWSMPNRPAGFYHAWRTVAAHDRSMSLLGIRTWPSVVLDLPARPEDCIVSCLRSMKVPETLWEPYLTRHMTRLPGWAGFIRWRALQHDYPMQQRHPVDPTDYLAARLVYESVLVDGASGVPDLIELEETRHRTAPIAQGEEEEHPLEDQAVPSPAWRLFQLAQFVGLSGAELRLAAQADCRTLLAVLDALPPESHGPIWQDAFERAYRRRLLATLKSGRLLQSILPARPKAQAVFCIDVRSEVLRRHLEAQGDYETFGFAGFFGVPLRFRPFDREDEQLLCPVLISPKHVGTELPRPGQDEQLRHYLSGSRWSEALRHLLYDLKAHPLASYLVVDVVGALYAVALGGKTLCGWWARWLRARLTGWLGQPVSTAIPFAPMTRAGAGPTQPEPRRSSVTATEEAAFVETSLRMMGLTSRFARLVLFCGHSSTSENNPLAAALDCGACGGNPGGPNARVLARMANSPAVRELLRERGITIPDETWFVAGRHDTTTDRVTVLDVEDLPQSHRADLAALVAALDRAGHETARERCGRLPGGGRVSRLPEAKRHVLRRSVDWSQIRPEWGLSSNAACVIGRRALTRGVNLGGRVFLHSYDPEQDAHGKILELLMTAPLVVMKMINLQYYFSAVDSWTYGCGSKVLHNVVGGVGVMLGRESDLQTGLPLQSLMDGPARFHEPLRLQAVIEAPTERIEAVIQRHRELRQTFDNQWIRLVALDPATGAAFLYRPGGHWESCTPAEASG